MRLQSIPILLMFFSFVTVRASNGRIDEQHSYRLTNSYLGSAYSLGINPDVPDMPVMVKSRDSAGQHWKFAAHDGCYRLTNVMVGADRSLDSYSDGGNDPFMGQSGAYSGQCWHLTPVSDGYVRLTNDFLGNSRSLDTHSEAGHKPCMADRGNYSGQLWRITATAPRRSFT